MASSSRGQSQDRGAASGSADKLRESTAGLGSEMKHEAVDQAGRVQQQTSESIHGFAEAIRHAGEELAAKDQGPAAQLLGQAAGGLEQISGALGRKRFDEIVGDIRRLGRDHPGAFLAGSVLMGMALGRMAQGGMSGGPHAEHVRDGPHDDGAKDAKDVEGDRYGS